MNSIATAGITLILLGGYVAGLNWWGLYASYRHRRFHSSVPLIGSILLGTGMFLIPATRRYAVTAVLMDYGTLVLLLSIPLLARELFKTRARNSSHS